ncbi:hypothetical protein K469DRAFT_716381 [Zopfia rhizophila CBS 207.26]|uniref:t-SNARE coiled-coil homology domain-containing protein n=1 Tax=Zopfia rhizophila CBS 207.26 TaxID=1314779 RepID=A0A6A6DMC4_9PEZI|nr:hypothetical protein K469DRAFT_716381 [Zopfia rhizophila CBS 207.26]
MAMQNQELVDYHNKIVELQAGADTLLDDLQKERQKSNDLASQLSTRDAEVTSKDAQLASHQQNIARLQARLDAKADELQNQKEATTDIERNLERTYADVATAQDKYNKALRERNDLEVHLRESELKLQSLHEEWEQDRHKIDELERAKEDLPALHTQVQELSNELEAMKEDLDESHRLKDIKDERIRSLEDQLQKEQLKTGKFEKAVAEAASPSATPNIVVGGDSLESELEALDEDLQSEEDPAEYLDFSDITPVVNIAPIELPPPQALDTCGTTTVFEQTPIVPALGFSKLSYVATEPVFVQLRLSDIHSTETEPTPPELTLSGIESVDTEPVHPELTLAGIFPVETKPIEPPAPAVPALIETAPIEPALAVVALDFSTISAVDTAPIEPSVSASTVSVLVQKPSLTQNVLTYVCAFLVILCAFFWMQVPDFNEANTPSYGRSYSGAYGTPGHFLGIIPVGWEIGDSAWSENVGRVIAMGLQRFEQWAEVDRGIYY